MPGYMPLQQLGMDPQRAIAQMQASKAQVVDDAMHGQIVNPVPGATQGIGQSGMPAMSNAPTAGAPSPGGMPVAPNAPQPNDPSALYRGMPSRPPMYRSFPPVMMR